MKREFRAENDELQKNLLPRIPRIRGMRSGIERRFAAPAQANSTTAAPHHPRQINHQINSEWRYAPSSACAVAVYNPGTPPQ
jgi:hypothetical protein